MKPSEELLTVGIKKGLLEASKRLGETASKMNREGELRNSLVMLDAAQIVMTMFDEYELNGVEDDRET